MTKHYIKLPYTLFKIEGPDAAKFLQGQVSCDIESLAENSWTFGTANTPKGRMYWLFVVARIGDAFWIRVHEDIADSGIQNLHKYKVFFKCEITPQPDYAVYGTHSPFEHAGQAISNETEGYLRAADASSERCELWSNQNIEATAVADEIQAWFQEDCKQGIPELYSETLDTFILQQLNLQELGAVSFNKGCYTGQEIIARMKFLGKLKKKMYLFSHDQRETGSAVPGSNIVDRDGKKVGLVVRAHAFNDSVCGLVVCDIAFADNNEQAFLATASESPIQIAKLHYNLH